MFQKISFSYLQQIKKIFFYFFWTLNQYLCMRCLPIVTSMRAQLMYLTVMLQRLNCVLTTTRFVFLKSASVLRVLYRFLSKYTSIFMHLYEGGIYICPCSSVYCKLPKVYEVMSRTFTGTLFCPGDFSCGFQQ